MKAIGTKVLDLMAALKKGLAPKKHVYLIEDVDGEQWCYVAASESEARREHYRYDGERVDSIEQLPDDQVLTIGGDVSAADVFPGAHYDDRGTLIAPVKAWAAHTSGCIGSSVY